MAIASNGSAMLSCCVPLVATAFFAASGNQIWTAAALFIVIALATVAGGYFSARMEVHP